MTTGENPQRQIEGNKPYIDFTAQVLTNKGEIIQPSTKEKTEKETKFNEEVKGAIELCDLIKEKTDEAIFIELSTTIYKEIEPIENTLKTQTVDKKEFEKLRQEIGKISIYVDVAIGNKSTIDFYENSANEHFKNDQKNPNYKKFLDTINSYKTKLDEIIKNGYKNLDEMYKFRKEVFIVSTNLTFENNNKSAIEQIQKNLTLFIKKINNEKDREKYTEQLDESKKKNDYSESELKNLQSMINDIYKDLDDQRKNEIIDIDKTLETARKEAIANISPEEAKKSEREFLASQLEIVAKGFANLLGITLEELGIMKKEKEGKNATVETQNLASLQKPTVKIKDFEAYKDKPTELPKHLTDKTWQKQTFDSETYITKEKDNSEIDDMILITNEKGKITDYVLVSFDEKLNQKVIIGKDGNKIDLSLKIFITNKKIQVYKKPTETKEVPKDNTVG